MKLNPLLLLSTVFIITACGTGNTVTGTTYNDAGGTQNYMLAYESGNTPVTISINVTGSSGSPLPLTLVSPNIYSFSTGSESALMYFNPDESAMLAISFTGQGTSSTTDFATNTVSSTLPTATYNTICDHSNLSACQVTINNNQISIVEYSPQGASTSLCTNATLTSNTTPISQYLYTFICGTNGSSSNAGTWYLTPFSLNNTTALMLSEFDSANLSKNINTDEIAFMSGQSLNPNGSYGYIYNSLGGASTTQSGVSTAQLTPAIISNTISGCNLCVLQQNSYYLMPLQGFNYYEANNQQTTSIFYNFVGNDALNLYMDSYTGFYLPSN